MHWFQNFHACIQKRFPGKIECDSVVNIKFKDDIATGSSAEIEYPKQCNGWTITPSRPCKVKLINYFDIDGSIFIAFRFLKKRLIIQGHIGHWRITTPLIYVLT